MHLKKQTFGNIFQNGNRIFTPKVTLLLFLLCLNYSKIKDTGNIPAFSIDNPSHAGSNKAGSGQKKKLCEEASFWGRMCKIKVVEVMLQLQQNFKGIQTMGMTPVVREWQVHVDLCFQRSRRGIRDRVGWRFQMPQKYYHAFTRNIILPQVTE